MLVAAYDRILQIAARPYAVFVLAIWSVFEAFIFPIPPDALLVPMALARPNRAFRYVGITTVCSVLGGALGYGLGFFCYKGFGAALLQKLGYLEQYGMVEQLFTRYGMGLILLACITPLPYKLLTVGAGFVHYNFFKFMLAAWIGRSIRYSIVGGLIFYAGERGQIVLRGWIQKFGWSLVGLVGIIFLVRGTVFHASNGLLFF